MQEGTAEKAVANAKEKETYALKVFNKDRIQEYIDDETGMWNIIGTLDASERESFVSSLTHLTSVADSPVFK